MTKRPREVIHESLRVMLVECDLNAGDIVSRLDHYGAPGTRSLTRDDWVMNLVDGGIHDHKDLDAIMKSVAPIIAQANQVLIQIANLAESKPPGEDLPAVIRRFRDDLVNTALPAFRSAIEQLKLSEATDSPVAIARDLRALATRVPDLADQLQALAARVAALTAGTGSSTEAPAALAAKRKDQSSPSPQASKKQPDRDKA